MHVATLLAAGMGGDDGGMSTGTIVAIVIAVVVAAGLVARSRQTHRARARVTARLSPDTGHVQLHDLPAPGAVPSIAVGVTLTGDSLGTVSISEEHP